MPISHSTLSVLSLLPNLELEGTQIYPVKREVNRNALLDVAPDRESLLISDQNIEEVRRLSRSTFRLPLGMFYCSIAISHLIYVVAFPDIGCTMLRNAR